MADDRNRTKPTPPDEQVDRRVSLVLRLYPDKGVAELAAATGLTRTAVRASLARLAEQEK